MAPSEWLSATVGPETGAHVRPSAGGLHSPARGLSSWLLVPPHSVASQDSLTSKTTHVKAARPS